MNKVRAMTISVDPEAQKIVKKIPAGLRSKVICELLKRFANQNPSVNNRSVIEVAEVADTDFKLESIRKKVQPKKKKNTRSVL